MPNALRPLLLTLCLLGILFSWRFEAPEWYIYQALIFALLTLASFHLCWNWTFLPILAIAAWPIGQLLTGATIYANATYLQALRLTTYAALFILAASLFRRRFEIAFLLRVLIVFSLILAALASMQLFTYNGKVFWIFPLPRPYPKIMGPILNTDHYASYMLLIIPMALLSAFVEPRRRAFYLLAAAAMYASVIASQSRAGSLIATTEILLCLIFLTVRRPDPGRTGWILASVLLFLALAAVVGWDPLWQRFQQEDPYSGRREVALATLNMIREKPLTGTGLGTWTRAYPAHALFDPGVFVNAAHNDWLQWAADGGLIFASLFVILFAVSLITAWNVPWALGIPAVFIHSMIDFPLDGHYLAAIFFLIFGAAVGAASEKRKGRPFGKTVELR